MKIKLFTISFLFLLIITSCKFSHEPKVVVSIASQQYEVIKSDKLSPDAEIDSIISIYKKGVDSIMNKVVIYSKQSMDKSKPSGPLDNLITDAMLSEINKVVEMPVDIAFYNYYGIRQILPKGKVVIGNIFEILPFENQTTLVHLNPKGMRAMLQYMYRTGGQPISGIDITYIDSLNYKVIIGDNDWDSTKYYWVATSDYAANGGDNMNFFKESDSIFYTGVLLRDNLLNYIDIINNNGDLLEADTLLRIRFIEENRKTTKR